jgi:hypothetical protein
MNRYIQHETKIVKSSDDFELDIKRQKGVLYHYSYPKAKKLKGIVFVIPGFGADTNSDYAKNLREYIADSFDVMAVSVIYHCYNSRDTNGAILSLDAPSKNLQTATLIPPFDEYQNFGILQALDHINVLREIQKSDFEFIDSYPTILMGSSHGAYIANLVAKIIPSKIDCVIDNSSYVNPPIKYICGKYVNPLDPEYMIKYPNVIVNCFVKTHWRKDEDSFYNYSKDRELIRSLSYKEHNEMIAKVSDAKIRYVSYHSAYDKLALYDDKVLFYKQLKDLGFDAKLKTISTQEQVDGKFIKNLEHGLGMSMKELANHELPQALKIKSFSSKKDFESISYKCDEISYDFQIIDGVYTAEQSPLRALEEYVQETFENNIKYFELNHPDIYSKLASLDSAVEQGLYQNRYDLIFNNNYFDVKEFSSGNYLYGTNSKKYAFEVSKDFTENSERFVFFGIGLATHIRDIAKKVQAQRYLIVEHDLELFKLSTLITPYYDIGKESELVFSVLESEDEFLEKAKEFLAQKSFEFFQMQKEFRYKELLFEKLKGEKL